MSTFFASPRARVWRWSAVALGLMACGQGELSESRSRFVANAPAGAAGAGGTPATGGSAGTGGLSVGGGEQGGAPLQPAPGDLLASHNEHTCARLSGGQLTCWGFNFVGELGLGDHDSRGDQPGELGTLLPPVDLGTGAQVTAIATGFGHGCAVLTSGRVKCWGSAAHGVLGVVLPSFNLGDEPGEMGDALPFVDLGTGLRAIGITAGAMHTCVLFDTGQVKCWGYNFDGQLGLGDEKSRGDEPGEMGDALPFVDLGAGAHAVALRAGQHHTCAVLDTGQVKCWGDNLNGQLGLGDLADRGDDPGEMGDALPFVNLGKESALSVVAGHVHTCALLVGGRVKCWGLGGLGALGLGAQTLLGDQPGEMGDALPFVDLGSSAPITALTAGSMHTCALFATGQVKCWGAQTFGQLGLGDQNHRGDIPGEMGDALPFVDLGTGLVATALGAGYQHTCARFTDGRVKCWGLNAGGELGLGDTTERGNQPGQMGDALPFVELPAPVDP